MSHDTGKKAAARDDGGRTPRPKTKPSLPMPPSYVTKSLWHWLKRTDEDGHVYWIANGVIIWRGGGNSGLYLTEAGGRFLTLAEAKEFRAPYEAGLDPFAIGRSSTKQLKPKAGMTPAARMGVDEPAQGRCA